METVTLHNEKEYIDKTDYILNKKESIHFIEIGNSSGKTMKIPCASQEIAKKISFRYSKTSSLSPGC